MSKKHRFAVLDPDRKNRRKKIRSVIQAAVIALLSYVLVQEVFLMKTYETPDVPMANDDGFIAISYPGASRDESGHSLSKDELSAHLSALKRSGFETVSQRQVLEFYRSGSPLPEKAMYLSFEDGQRDTVIYAQPALEKLNYKATLFTYADHLVSDDRSYLKANHLKTMMRSGYWEMATNGYQLAYTNAFNREGHYMGELNADEVSADMDIVRSNHPLMDFLRDENGIPKEDADRMKERISGEYADMKELYTRELGDLPDVYAIPRPNVLYQDMHPAVEEVNDRNIRTYYKLHFNRSGGLFNGPDDSVTDLTRLRVGPDWPVNHLLMTIREETGMRVSFETGDQEKADRWTIRGGAAEFRGEQAILTSEPGAEVTALLKEPLPEDAIVQATLGKSAALGIADGTGKAVLLSVEKGQLVVRKAGKVVSKHQIPRKNETGIRLEVRDHLLHVRVNEGEDFTIDAGQLDPAEGYRLQLAGLSDGNAIEDEENAITDAFFTNLHVTSSDSVVYSDVPSGFDKVKDKVGEWFGHLFYSLMDRF
ncbi:polysaccharide deacetylase family protein [Bhargavaea cecembensis]|nr:polysaccharide deacetylase family protein [Bhargavaea cecembensis]